MSTGYQDPLRDKDGFYILRRREPAKELSPRDLRWQQINRIGRETIFPVKSDLSKGFRTSGTVKRVFERGNSEAFEITYKPKTWQYKAWSFACDHIPWGTVPFGARFEGSGKFHHMLTMVLFLKIRTGNAGTKAVQIDALTQANSGYAVLTDPQSFVQTLNLWYTMWNSPVKINQYLDAAEAVGCSKVSCISKVMLIYDDYTFDAWQGNMEKLPVVLGLKFDNKGRAILRERR